MLISATRRQVKMRRKRKKVVATPEAGTSLADTQVGSMSWMVQGWRPISATIQPASLHTQAKGMRATPMRSSQR